MIERVMEEEEEVINFYFGVGADGTVRADPN